MLCQISITKLLTTRSYETRGYYTSPTNVSLPRMVEPPECIELKSFREQYQPREVVTETNESSNEAKAGVLL